MKQFCTILFAISIILNIEAQQARFDRFDVSNGLSQNNINCLELDEYGNIWVGTLDGLNRYCGNSFQPFNPNNPNQGFFPGNHIVALGKGLHGNMWILIRGSGLCEYKASTNSFKPFNQKLFAPYNLEQSIFIIQTSDSLLWFTNGTDLILWEINTTKITTYRTTEKIRKIIAFDKESVLIGGNFGIKKITKKTGKNQPILTAITNFDQPCYALVSKNNKIYTVCKQGILALTPNLSIEQYCIRFDNNNFADKLNRIVDFAITDDSYWLGGNGFLNRFTLENNQYQQQQFNYESNNKFAYKGYNITRMIEDKFQNIWIGTRKNGLFHFNYSKNQFQHYAWDYSTTTDPETDPVRAICKASDGKLWLGFDRQGVGVILQDGTFKYFTHYYTKSNKQKTIENVREIFEDSNNEIWIGENTNLCYYNADKQRIETADSKYNLYCTFHSYAIKEFTRGKITITAEQNILDFDKKKGIYAITKLPQPIAGTIRDITVDKYGNRWIALDFKGVAKIAGNDGSMSNITTHSHHLSDNKVYALLAIGDSLWIGTNKGLNLFNIKKGTIEKVFYEEDGLCNNVIYSISKDKLNDLWISTNRGISHFDHQSSVFTTYLPADYFMDDAHFTTHNGTIFYGGYTGVISFDPINVKQNRPVIKPRIEKISLFNTPIYQGDTIDGDVILNQPIDQAKQIDFKYTQNSFSIEFNAYPFDYPNSNHLRYRLLGFQNEWIDCKNQQMATYTNIAPGKYIFQVQVSPFSTNSENSTDLEINIAPAFWMTAWFKIVLTSLLLLMLLVLYRLRVKQIKQRNKWLSIKVEEQTSELRKQNTTIVEISQKLHEADQSKLQFFTNISHEFRTPLTLILGQIETLQSESKSSIKSIKSNAHRLLRLVNQLIDLRKLDQDRMPLSVTYFDIVSYVREIVASFQSLAEQKNSTLITNFATESLHVWLDMDKTEKILYNLLSNAIKYSKNGQAIEISILTDETTFTLAIRDHGIGIPKNEVDRIFDHFYRAENRPVNSDGHGIGLSMVKALTQIQHGTIEVESEIEKGSCFRLKFKLGKAHFTAADFGNENKENTPCYADDYEIKPSLNIAHLGGKNILIVEDNQELATFIASLYEPNFSVKIAANGKIALEMMQTFHPEIIISDIMMPEMDGITFCKIVKSDIETSHIPIILLTAKTDIDTQMVGFEQGADDYIEKPFNNKILIARTYALLLNREKIRDQFKQSANKIPASSNLSPREQEFIKKVNTTIDTHFHDSLFTIEVLSEKMNMSRATFYRKFSDLTGTSPADYIRKVRLRNAYHLLDTSTISIAEICEKSGFQSVSHFRKCFKDEFGQSPSEIQNGR